MKNIILILLSLVLLSGCQTNNAIKENVIKLKPKQDIVTSDRAKYITLNSTVPLNIWKQTKDTELPYMPNNPPIPKEVAFLGVTSEQWKIIDKLGDPLNCRK